MPQTLYSLFFSYSSTFHHYVTLIHRLSLLISRNLTVKQLKFYQLKKCRCRPIHNHHLSTSPSAIKICPGFLCNDDTKSCCPNVVVGTPMRFVVGEGSFVVLGITLFVTMDIAIKYVYYFKSVDSI